METGVRHETVTRREWLRAGAGNDTIKETEKTQKKQSRHRVTPSRHRVDTEQDHTQPGSNTALIRILTGGLHPRATASP